MNIKAIILDLDGTALNHQKQLSPHTLEVLGQCRKNGMKIMIASARPLRDVRFFTKALAPDAISALNGAKIILPEREESCALDPVQAENLLKTLCFWDVPLSLEMENQVYSNVPIPEYPSCIYTGFPKLPVGEAPYKILVNRVNEKLLRDVATILPENLYSSIAIGKMIQIMDKRATKWNAVQTMLHAMGFTPEEAIYFGDDYDDIQPIRECGIGVAMENAIDAVKASADYIAGSNQEDGVARFLEDHILNIKV